MSMCNYMQQILMFRRAFAYLVCLRQCYKALQRLCRVLLCVRGSRMGSHRGAKYPVVS